MDSIRLKQLLTEYSALAVDAIPVQYKDDSDPQDLTIAELFEVWSKEPECLLSPMFLGYVLGEGEDINSFSPLELHLAILSIHESKSSNVDFDWLGELDVKNKPH